MQSSDGSGRVGIMPGHPKEGTLQSAASDFRATFWRRWRLHKWRYLSHEESFVTAKNSDSTLLYRPRIGSLSHRLAIGAALCAAAFAGRRRVGPDGAIVRTASATASASTPANPDQRPDSAIAEDINTKLMASNTLRPLNLGIWVHDGTATLTGTVPTQELRTEAENMVKSVAGVTECRRQDHHRHRARRRAWISGQNGEGQGAVHPGDAQGPPPPPPAGYERE